MRLDQPIRDLLPAGTIVPTAGGREITLEQLITHRSGLARNPYSCTRRLVTGVSFNEQQLYRRLTRCPLRFLPGDSAVYSNLGVGLLGLGLTRATGHRSWEGLLFERITRPLGMRETFVSVPDSVRPRLAVGLGPKYRPADPLELSAIVGAGSVRSSAADMITYLAAHVDSVGPLASSTRLARTPRARFAKDVQIAMGWMHGEGDGLWTHGGNTQGFNAFAAFDPEAGLAIVVLNNATERSAAGIAGRVLESGRATPRPR